VKIIEGTGIELLHYLHPPAANVKKVARYAVNFTLRFGQSKAIVGLYKAQASITMKSSKLLKVVLAGACTLGLATVSLAVPACAQSGGGSASGTTGTTGSDTSGTTGTTGTTGSATDGTTVAPADTNSGVLSDRHDRHNNLGWLGILGAFGLLNLFRKNRTAPDR
jgi:hypothetical protein